MASLAQESSLYVGGIVYHLLHSIRLCLTCLEGCIKLQLYNNDYLNTYTL